MTRAIRGPAGWVCALLLTITGCGGPAAPSEPTQPGTPPATTQPGAAPVASAPTLSLVGGNDQSAPPGQALSQLLVVQAVGSGGAPVPNVAVSWATPSGGSLQTYAGVTDAYGRAAARWTLGPSLGVQNATASVAGAAPVRFAAQAVPGTPAPVASVNFGLGSTWLEPGEASSVYGAALDAAGLVVPSAAITWTVDRPGIVALEVKSIGPGTSRLQFTGLAPGEAYVTGAAGGKSNTFLVRVFPKGQKPGPGDGCGGCA